MRAKIRLGLRKSKFGTETHIAEVSRFEEVCFPEEAKRLRFEQNQILFC